ncbi:MAG: hypothetical protein K5923_05300 [Clostridia bacterium]|nr:hypothetical protein [Clostridia bacterium]
MLRRIVGTNKGLFKIIIMALLGLIIAFDLVVTLGSNGNNAAFNTGNFLSFIIFGGLLGMLLYCVIANEDGYAKWLGVAYLIYIVISKLLAVAQPFYAFYDGNSSLSIAGAVFRLLAGFVLVAIVVVETIRIQKGRNLELVFDILVLSYIALMLLDWFLCLAYYSQVNSNWKTIMASFSDYLFVPCLMAIGYLYLTTRTTPVMKDVDYDDDAIVDEEEK